MDIRKVPNDQKLELCRWYFKAGFLFLPFVWTVNAIWFYESAFKKPPYDEQPEIRKYVIWSAVGATIWMTLLISWIVVFQTQRVKWGPTGDSISFIVPLGRA